MVPFAPHRHSSVVVIGEFAIQIDLLPLEKIYPDFRRQGRDFFLDGVVDPFRKVIHSRNKKVKVAFPPVVY